MSGRGKLFDRENTDLPFASPSPSPLALIQMRVVLMRASISSDLFPTPAPRPILGFLTGIVALLAVAFAPAVLKAEDPLHAKIDQAFEAAALGPVAEPVGDLTFARRIYLDLIGRIPSSTEAHAFLEDTSADRRARLIDRLLASEDYARVMEILDSVRK